MRCWKGRAENTLRCGQRVVRIWLLGVVCALSGCGLLIEQTPGYLAVRSARIMPAADGSVLLLDLDCRLSGPMRDALDHGIPITLRVQAEGRAPDSTAHARASQSIELRYFPLSRRYQLRQLDDRDVRTFTAPAAMIDALSGLRVSLPGNFAELPSGSNFAVDVGIDRTALPGALRVPATLEPAWWLSANTWRWIG